MGGPPTTRPLSRAAEKQRGLDNLASKANSGKRNFPLDDYFTITNTQMRHVRIHPKGTKYMSLNSVVLVTK
jgi:hypothetical protein